MDDVSFNWSKRKDITLLTDYAETFSNNTTLLVDTYDPLNNGIPNAAKIFTIFDIPASVSRVCILTNIPSTTRPWRYRSTAFVFSG